MPVKLPLIHKFLPALGRVPVADPPAPPQPEPLPPPQAAPPALTPQHLHSVLDHLRPGALSDLAPDLADLHQTADALGLDLSAAAMMTPDPVTALPQADFRTLSGLFTRHTLRAMPVVDGQNHLLGMVPLAQLLRPGASGLTAAHLMQPAETVPPDATLSDLLTAFAQTRQTALLVVTGDGTLMGILTRTDIVAALIRALSHL